MYIQRIFLFSIIILVADTAVAASFDCEKASGLTETVICQDDTLNLLDSEIARIYHEFLGFSNQLEQARVREEQRQWLRQERERFCFSAYPCLLEHARRLEKLKKELMKHQVSKILPNLEGKSTNILVHKPYFIDFIRYFSGASSFELLGNPWPLSYDLTAVLGGPQNSIERIGDVFIGSACRFRSCGEKGIFAIKSSDLSAIFGVSTSGTLTLFYRDKNFFDEFAYQIVSRAKAEADDRITRIKRIRLVDGVAHPAF